jgi:hypothetical protein
MSPKKLEIAIAEIKAGNKSSGLYLLSDVVKAEPKNELAWLWLATCVDSIDKKKFCLNKALSINPNNQIAHKALSQLDRPPEPSLEEIIANPVTVPQPTTFASTKQVTRKHMIRDAVKELIGDFERFVQIYNSQPPFRKYGQLEFHQYTISCRRRLSSPVEAIHDDIFLESLYKTLHAWGIGVRASHLVPYSEFKKELQSKSDWIARFDGLKISDTELDIRGCSSDLWQLIDSLEIVRNNAKLVACSKALHHILPDLVVPIDREYTRKFFGWHGPKFQYNQHQFLTLAFENFAAIARATQPEKYIGERWNTCQTKILDNAIVGYMTINPRKDL